MQAKVPAQTRKPLRHLDHAGSQAVLPNPEKLHAAIHRGTENASSVHQRNLTGM